METYLRHKILNVIDIKEIIALEYLDFEGKYRQYVEKHDYWELCYVESGNVSLTVDKREFDLSDNEIMLVAPNVNHSYYSKKGNASKVFVMCFESSSRFIQYLEEIKFVPNDEQVDCIQRIINEYKQIFYFNENGTMKLLKNSLFGGVQVIILQLEYLLICLLRTLSLDKNPEIVFFNDNEFYEGITGVIMDFFKANITKKLTLKDICARVNYSSSFLCKTFKAQTGETLMGCFNRLKVEKAKELLSSTERPVFEISFELGMTDAKYFVSMFKKITGMSPTEYRKKNKI